MYEYDDVHMLTKRTNILFDEETWSALEFAAKLQKTSVGALVRQAVKQLLNGQAKRERITQAHQEILDSRPAPRSGKTDYQELVDERRD